MYSAGLGRFLSQDPVSTVGPDVLTDNNPFGESLTRMRNLYGYAENDPVRWVDPSGLRVASSPPSTWEWICTKVGTGASATWRCCKWVGGAPIAFVCIVLDPTTCHAPEVSQLPPLGGPKRNCKLIGSGECNRTKGLKRCTYTCDGKPSEDIPIPCGPGNWDPACPGSDGKPVEL